MKKIFEIEFENCDWNADQISALINSETGGNVRVKELLQEYYCGCDHIFTPGKSIPISGWKDGEPICDKCKKPLRSFCPKFQEQQWCECLEPKKGIIFPSKELHCFDCKKPIEPIKL